MKVSVQSKIAKSVCEFTQTKKESKQMRNRKTYIVLAIVVLVASAALVAFALQPSAKDLMLGAIETMQTTTDGHTIATFTMTTPEESATGTLEMWGKLSEDPETLPSFRVEVLNASEAELVGITAVSDGENFWMYDPSENKVLVGTAEEAMEMMKEHMEGKEFDEFDHEEFDPEEMDHPETPEEAVDKVLEYFDAERIADLQIGDTNAHGFRLIPIPDQMPDEVRAAGGFFRVYVRPEDGAPLAVEYAEGMMGSGSATATSLEINQGVDDSLFTFAIPDGAEVLTLEDIKPEQLSPEEAAELDVLSPTNLPADATHVSTTGMRGAIVQRFNRADGSSFTVSQGPANAVSERGDTGESVTVRGVEGTLFTNEEGNQALLTWSDGEKTFWIGGQVTGDEALAIAESLE
jgi:outer membrane lipoprotein-sorting protein